MSLLKLALAILMGVITLTSHVRAEQSEIIGVWQTIDDDTHKVRSLVELSITDGKLFGTIIKLFPEKGDPNDPICDKCEGAQKNSPVLGLKIIDGLALIKGKWRDGEILDPDNGKIYDCRIWEEDGKLMVRGYIGFFFRTQEWIRHQSNEQLPSSAN